MCKKLKSISLVASLIAVFAFSSSALASEQSELAQAVKQLNAAKQSLQRAQAQARNVPTNRFYFDYRQAHADINVVAAGINHFLNNDRAQPRQPEQLQSLDGDYLQQNKAAR
ncbi:RAQPRD family integrative conjugative element protein [Gallibacterium anatis]|uniref:integrative conjugative element protein, RAQPRD family n=1 Tax=Gallibacterium anatis TaxID=750 RepID=UPI00080272E3|nr:RAQPRD family integrative conjugative element protein [Gallibacterium anatis]OBW94616.1 conjugal transfer protein [Gallibacterium anatis]